MRGVLKVLLTGGAVILLVVIFVSWASAAIYWETGEGIGRANLDGTNMQRAFIPIVQAPGTYVSCGGVAVDGSHIYWANTSHNAVGRANLDGTSPDYNFISTATETCGVAVDQGHVYWANTGDVTVGRASLDGTTADQAFIKGPSRPCDVEVDATHVFWGNVTQNWLSRADLDGEAVVPNFIEGAGGGCGIAVAGNHIYWSDLDRTIGRANLDGSEPNYAFITDLNRPCGIAIEGGYIFWAEQDIGEKGQIGRANLDGTEVNRKLIPEVRIACGVAADGRVVPSLSAPPSPPLRHISFGRVRHSKHRAATFVALRVPQAGSIKVIIPTQGVGWKLNSGTPDLPHGGKWWLKLAPKGTKPVKRKFLGRLKREGRILVAIRVEYTTDGGTASTLRKTFWLSPP